MRFYGAQIKLINTKKSPIFTYVTTYILCNITWLLFRETHLQKKVNLGLLFEKLTNCALLKSRFKCTVEQRQVQALSKTRMFSLR